MEGKAIAIDVAVVGSINADVTAKGAVVPRAGETRAADDLFEGFGGKGANQAIAAAKMGARVAMVGRVGDDPRGRASLENLRSRGIDVANVHLTKDARTGVAVIFVGGDGEKSIFVFSGANARVTAADVRAAGARLRGTKVVLAQLEVPDEAVLAAAQVAKDIGARFVLDPAPARALPDEIWPLVDVVKPNASEAETLTGITVRDRPSAVRAARALLDRGVFAVTVASAEGNHLVTREGEHHFARHDVRAIDATGAGDAFIGAMAAMLVEGRTLEDAARFANAAAALKTTNMGAQSLPSREAITALLGHVH